MIQVNTSTSTITITFNTIAGADGSGRRTL
jgi:hypothetical protein